MNQIDYEHAFIVICDLFQRFHEGVLETDERPLGQSRHPQAPDFAERVFEVLGIQEDVDQIDTDYAFSVVCDLFERFRSGFYETDEMPELPPMTSVQARKFANRVFEVLEIEENDPREPSHEVRDRMGRYLRGEPMPESGS